MKVQGGNAIVDNGDLTISITQTKALLRQRNGDATLYHPLRNETASQFLLAALPMPAGWSFGADRSEVVAKTVFRHEVTAQQFRVVPKQRKSGFAIMGPDGVMAADQWNQIAIAQPDTAERTLSQQRKHRLDLIELRDVCIMVDEAGYVLFNGAEISPHTGAYPVFPPPQGGNEIRLKRLYFAGDIHTHDNIAHFLLDSLFRAWTARERFAMTGAEIGFPEYRLPYCNTLRQHLFPDSTTLQRGHVYRVAQLYLTGYTLQMGGLHPANALDPAYLSWLRQAAPQVRTADLPDRIYISRQDAKGRPMVNEAEILAMVERAGFTPVVMSKLPVADQIALFAAARVIVGAHGAGMANVAFCRPGTRVVELYSRDGVGTDAFERLGTTLGLRMTPLFGLGVAKDHPAFGRRGWTMEAEVLAALLGRFADDKSHTAQ